MTMSGIAKVSATTSLVTKVEMVAAQTWRSVESGSASCARWIPSASDIASATATTNMPPSTATSDWVPECRPTIRPIVVMAPDVAPKYTPVRVPLFFNSRFMSASRAGK